MMKNNNDHKKRHLLVSPFLKLYFKIEEIIVIAKNSFDILHTQYGSVLQLHLMNVSLSNPKYVNYETVG